MKEFVKHLPILIISFAIALLAIIGLSHIFSDYTLLHFFKGTLSLKEDSVTIAKKPAIEPSRVPISTKLSQEYAALSQAVIPSLISIDTAGSMVKQGASNSPFVKPKSRSSQGSGVIVSEEGHIITNHHVIANKAQIFVTLYDGIRLEATLIGYDPSLDIAVLKISHPLKLKPLKFGDSDRVREGHLVMAFGNPYGMGRSITNGIISARKSSRSDLQTSLFQTNVAINPGNSGGPLVNVIGEIVGINSAIYSNDPKNPSFQGISFAIPSNLVKKTFFDILQFQRPMRGYLGLYVEDLSTPETRKKTNYSGKNGVIIRQIEKSSPAEKAGLQKSDVILAYNGQLIKNKDDLMNQIQTSLVNKVTKIKIWREGALLELPVKPLEVDVGIAYLKQKKLSESINRSILNQIGISAIGLDQNYEIHGVRVTHVRAESLAENKIIVGDIIYKVNQNRIYHEAHLQQLILTLAPIGETHFFLIRNGKRLYTPITIPQVNGF